MILKSLGLAPPDVRQGELFYACFQPQKFTYTYICDELERLGIAHLSNGALCAFPPGFPERDGQPTPLIIRKSDGGYGYATTDLATVRYRVQKLGADEILYVVGAPQAQHFKMVWSVAKEAGWIPDGIDLKHVQIGSVLGKDNKMLRTRSGESFKLLDLIDTAIERASRTLELTGGINDERERSEAARIVGVGAVKYADLSVSHDTEYVFDFDRMTELHGNTAPYLQYAVVRIKSVLRKAEGLASRETGVKITLPEERELALSLLAFEEAVGTAGQMQQPHRLCAYLSSLAQRFSSFYDAAPILSAEDEERASRITLCEQTALTLETGLRLLGIKTPERM